MTGIEEKLSKQAPTVNGMGELLAQITPTSMAVTALIVVLGYGITWWVKRIFRQRDLQHKVPNWVNILVYDSAVFVCGAPRLACGGGTSDHRAFGDGVHLGCHVS